MSKKKTLLLSLLLILIFTIIFLVISVFVPIIACTREIFYPIDLPYIDYNTYYCTLGQLSQTRRFIKFPAILLTPILIIVFAVVSSVVIKHLKRK